MSEEPVTVLCPECGDVIEIKDIRAYILGLHQRVCPELEALHQEAT